MLDKTHTTLRAARPGVIWLNSGGVKWIKHFLTMNTKTLSARIDALEAKQRPALVIDAVVIGGAPIDGVVIVIGGNWRTSNHDANQPG